MNNIGARIKELRLSNELTQDELARKIKLSPKMVSFYELGQRMPSRESLIALSEVFGVSMDYILCKDNDLNSNPLEAADLDRTAAFNVPEEFVVMARKTGEMTDEDRAMIYKIFDSTIDTFWAKYKR
jgi:transcriptional regulator with XRE-family HTH domain